MASHLYTDVRPVDGDNRRNGRVAFRKPPWKSGVTGEPLGERPNAAARALTMVFGTGLGTGYAERGQGTLGSLLLVILWVVFLPASIIAEIAAVILLHLVSVPLSQWGERMWGKDPGRITIDEWAGQALALLGVRRKPLPLLLAFLLFRVFDTFKPTFIRKRVETLPGGWGVTLDDTAAGLLARVSLAIILAVFQRKHGA